MERTFHIPSWKIFNFTKFIQYIFDSSLSFTFLVELPEAYIQSPFLFVIVTLSSMDFQNFLWRHPQVIYEPVDQSSPTEIAVVYNLLYKRGFCPKLWNVVYKNYLQIIDLLLDGKYGNILQLFSVMNVRQDDWCYQY